MTPRLSRRRFALAAGALAACSPRPKSASPARGTVVRIGYQKGGVLLLARARGGLAQQLAGAGVSDVQWAQFGAGPPLVEAMRAGALDFGIVGETPPVFAQAAGTPLVYVAAQPVTGASQGLVVPPASPARSVRDLKGKRIAFTKGTSAHLFIVKALASAGLGLADITPVNLSPADAAAAFANGALDGWVVWDPFYALVQKSQKARLIIDGRSLAPSSSFYIASRAFADASPGPLRALLNALAEQATWAVTHPGEASVIVQGATGLPADIVATAQSRGAPGVVPLTDDVLRLQQANADIMARVGLIPHAVDVREAVWTGWSPALAKASTPKA